MSKYIDAEHLKAEIDRLLAKAENDEKKAFAKKDAFGHLAAVTTTTVYVKIKKLISTLQQEQPEVELEKVIEDYYGNIPNDEDKVKAAHHFYDLGCRHAAVLYDDIEFERQRREERELPAGLDEAADKYEQEFSDDATLGEAFIAGAEWMAGQGYTQEGIARPDDCEIWVNIKNTDIKDGDKVVVQIRKK